MSVLVAAVAAGSGTHIRYEILCILDLPCGDALHAHTSSTATAFIDKMIRGEMNCGTLPEY